MSKGGMLADRHKNRIVRKTSPRAGHGDQMFMARTSGKFVPTSRRAPMSTPTISRPSAGRSPQSWIETIPNMDFPGYRPRERAGRRAQSRRHPCPSTDISETRLRAVANKHQGRLAIPHCAYGRLQFGEDLDLIIRTMIGTGLRTRMFQPSSSIGIGAGLDQEDPFDGIAANGQAGDRGFSRRAGQRHTSK